MNYLTQFGKNKKNTNRKKWLFTYPCRGGFICVDAVLQCFFSFAPFFHLPLFLWARVVQNEGLVRVQTFHPPRLGHDQYYASGTASKRRESPETDFFLARLLRFQVFSSFSLHPLNPLSLEFSSSPQTPDAHPQWYSNHPLSPPNPSLTELCLSFSTPLSSPWTQMAKLLPGNILNAGLGEAKWTCSIVNVLWICSKLLDNIRCKAKHCKINYLANLWRVKNEHCFDQMKTYSPFSSNCCLSGLFTQCCWLFSLALDGQSWIIQGGLLRST